MYNKGWNKLAKNNNASYKYKPETESEKRQCTTRLTFTQLAFDPDEEWLIVTDNRGYLHCVELFTETALYVKKLIKVGHATLLAFNPICKGEVLIGLDTGDVKIWKLHADVNRFSLLSGHKRPPTHISFYKSHCITCSTNEVMIWCLHSYNIAHRLKVATGNAVVKKAAFSNAGHIVVLYCNDTMQTWRYGRLDEDTKIDARKTLDTRYVRDFAFTKDGRAMIIASARDINILDTYDWSLLRKFDLPENFIEARQLSVMPCPLDGGANRIVALLSSRRILHFYDINTLSFLETPDIVGKIKMFVISPAGRYIAHIDQEDCLIVTRVDKMSSRRYRSRKSLEPRKLRAHGIKEHLECVRRSMKQALDTKRLMSILREFGEYPNKYRTLIWSTILKLPANKSAYIALVGKVTRGGFTTNTLKDYPLADRSKASLLATTMDCLLQWCPLLAQYHFLTNFVFPFLVVFQVIPHIILNINDLSVEKSAKMYLSLQKDPLLSFELILSILLNYCQNWLEYSPLPPLNVLGIIENMLLEADPVLLNTFCEHGITSSEYAWPLLRTAMSEVLSGDEWLILWDHLITSQRPSLFLMCVAAYSIYLRENIIALIKSSEDTKLFFSTQGHVRAKDLLVIVRRLDREIPDRVHPNRYLRYSRAMILLSFDMLYNRILIVEKYIYFLYRDKLLLLNQTGPYSSFILKEYPKFVIENSCIVDSDKCNVRERYLQDHERKMVEFAERRRLDNEIDAFTRQIHETRLNGRIKN